MDTNGEQSVAKVVEVQPSNAKEEALLAACVSRTSQRKQSFESESATTACYVAEVQEDAVSSPLTSLNELEADSSSDEERVSQGTGSSGVSETSTIQRQRLAFGPTGIL